MLYFIMQNLSKRCLQTIQALPFFYILDLNTKEHFQNTYIELSVKDMLSDSVLASELSDCSSESCLDTGLYDEYILATPDFPLK